MIRVGIGFDAHRFAPGRPLMLGGVQIPHNLGLAGHSDADVLLHAISDALLGSAGLPDIGHFFPPADEWKDASSRKILSRVVAILRDAGRCPKQVDTVVIAQSPPIAPHVGRMKSSIAAILGIDPELVGVKATTTEGMGFTGRGEGIAAQAVAVVVPFDEAHGY